LTGAYVWMKTDSQGRPVDQSHKLTNEQASAQRAKAPESDPPVFERKPTPLNSDDEGQPISYDQERALELENKMARQPLEKSSQASDSTHGIATLSQAKKASGAGDLRPAVGSGETDTCVANGHPSKS
jgi:hypothetical protein